MTPGSYWIFRVVGVGRSDPSACLSSTGRSVKLSRTPSGKGDRAMASEQNNLILRGGTVVDGTGAPPFEADVRVRAGRIVEVGAIAHPRGRGAARRQWMRRRSRIPGHAHPLRCPAVLGPRLRSQQPARRDHRTGGELLALAVSGQRRPARPDCRHVLLRRGHPVGCADEQRPVDLDRLRRLPRRRRCPGGGRECRRADGPFPAPAGRDGRRRLGAGRHCRRAQADGADTRRRHDGGQLGPFHLLLRQGPHRAPRARRDSPTTTSSTRCWT